MQNCILLSLVLISNIAFFSIFTDSSKLLVGLDEKKNGILFTVGCWFLCVSTKGDY